MVHVCRSVCGFLDKEVCKSHLRRREGGGELVAFFELKSGSK